MFSELPPMTIAQKMRRWLLPQLILKQILQMSCSVVALTSSLRGV
jgi:hypothetical protein